jgi:hypothetical protein
VDGIVIPKAGFSASVCGRSRQRAMFAAESSALNAIRKVADRDGV